MTEVVPWIVREEDKNLGVVEAGGKPLCAAMDLCDCQRLAAAHNSEAERLAAQGAEAESSLAHERRISLYSVSRQAWENAQARIADLERRLEGFTKPPIDL